MNIRSKTLRKIISASTGLLMVVQNMLPFVPYIVAESRVYAQEATPTETPAPTPDATPTDTVAPTPEPTVSPTAIETPAPTESILPTETLTPTPTEEISPSITPIETQTPNPTGDQPPQNNSPPASQGDILDGISTTATPEPTITPVIAPEPTEQGNLNAFVLDNVKAVSLDLDSIDTASSATLTTDKSDYAPTDTAVISGSGFKHDHKYNLTISSSDAPATSTTVEVKTNNEGAFVYAYQLDGNYRPNYSVKVTDQSGKIVAETTFTDSVLVAPATGGTNIPSTKAANGSAPAYTTLGNIVITEQANNDFAASQTGATLILTAPSGWTFNSGVGSVSHQNGRNITASSISVTSTTVTVTFSTESATNKTDILTISGLQVRAIDQTVVPGAGNILRTGSNAGTATIAGITNDSTNFGSLSQVASATPTSTPTGAVTPTPTPNQIGPISTQNTQCMADQPTAPGNLTCTANDIQLASVDNIHIVESSSDGVNFVPTNSTGCDYPGQYIKFSASWHVLSTATSRYNVGLWFANAGQTSALHGSCSASTLPNTPSPFFEETDDSCGDIHSGTTGTVNPDITVVARCVASPGTNQLSLPYCTSWNQNEQAGNACTGPEGTVPGAPSKCGCNDGFTIPITVPPAIEVIKNVVPASDSGKFNLQINGVTKKTDATNGDTTGKVGVPTGSNTFGEVAGTDTNLTNYASSASCVLRDTQTVVSTNQSGNTWTIANVVNGQDIVCTLTNTLQTGGLTVIKHVVGGTATANQWTMHVNQGATSDVVPSFAGVESPGVTVTNLTANTYTVTESSGPSGYTLSYSGDCNSSGNVTVVAGQTKTCTLTNSRDTGTLRVLKNVDLNGDGDTLDANEAGATDWKWQYDAGSDHNTGDSAITLATGNYDLTETNKTNFHFVNLSCAGGTLTGNSVAVTKDASVVCTFTNAVDSGNMIVKKVMVGGTDSFEFTGSPSGTIDANNGTITINNVAPGTYATSESATSGWDLTDLTCNDGESTTPSTVNANTRTATFKVDPGETVTCTFTNTKRGHLVVQKTTNPTADPNVFAILASGSGTITGGGSGTVTDATDKNYEVTPGTYSVTETVPGNWDQTSNTCSNVVVAAGQTTTCQIVNTKRGNVTVTKYHDHNANGVQDQGDEVLDGWEIHLGASSQFTGNQASGSGQVTFSDILPGSYNLSEQIKGGWHQSNISCTGDQGIDNDNSHPATVSAGQTTSCSIGNYQDGTITVTKRVLNPDGANITDTSTHFHFTVDQTGTNPDLTDDESQTFTVAPGLHTVVETPDGAYDFAGCTPSALGVANGTAVTVTSGQSVNVECTNTQKKATITVVKDVVKFDGSSVNDDHHFGVTLNGELQSFREGHNATFLVNPGSYGATESADVNYTEFSNDGPKTVTPNGSSTITIVNKQNPGTISGYKFKADGVTGILAWTINLFSCTAFGVNCTTFIDSTTTLANGFYSFDNLVSGFYQVVEDLTDTSYTPVTVTSHDATISAGLQSTGNNFSNFKNINITVCKVNDADGDIQTTEDRSPLSGWTMTLFSDGQQQGEAQNTGRENGCTTFTNLGPNHTYSVTETLQAGWANLTDLTHNFGTPTDGVNQNFTFINTPTGSLHGYKWDDKNGDGQRGEGENLLGNWTINLYRANAQEGYDFVATMDTIADDESAEFGWYMFQHLIPGDYKVCEDLKSGWAQTFPASVDGCHYFSLPNDSEFSQNGILAPEYDFGNRQTKFIIQKYDQSEHHLSGATFTICPDSKNVSSEDCVTVTDNGQFDTNDADGIIEVLGLAFGDYVATEIQAPKGYAMGEDNSCSRTITNEANSVSCSFVNEFIHPSLTITKSNNTGGADKVPGDNVLFTLTVTAADNDVFGVQVIDLPSKGFTYRPGSWTAQSSDVSRGVAGDLKAGGITTEPTYASPGTWQLGDMSAGETVTLTYVADISGDEQAGLYKDLAWAGGTDLLAGEVIANDPTVFVGTEVNVIRDNQNSISINIIREEGSVLGASTELPSTGASALWLALAGIAIVGGAGSMIYGISTGRKTKHKDRRIHA